MESNNWWPNHPGGEPAMDAGDWRTQLQPDSRQRIVNKIMETLKRRLPFSGQEGLNELKKIAVRLEEKIYTAATSQSDYLRKISLKMLTMETKSQANPLQSNSAGNSNKPPDPASHGMPSQVHNQGQSLPLPLSTNQSQAPQQLLNQNIQNNIASAGVQSSAGLPSSMPPGSSLTQTPVPNVVGQNSNMQSISGISQNSVGNSMGQGMPSNMFANSQRQMQGRQQVLPQQPQQQSLNPQQYLYQQQIQQQLMKQKLQQGNHQHSIMQSHIQQQQHQINDVSDLKMELHLLSLNTQNNIASADVQSFRGLPSDVFPAIASPDSMAQMGHANEDDWKEEVYQKIKAMKEMYLPELNELYQKIAAKLQQYDSLPQQPKSEQLEKLKVFKTMVERIITSLQVSKENVLPGFKEKLGSYEKQIINFVNTSRPGKAVSSLPQGQLPPPQGPPPPSQMHSMQQPQSQITQVQSHENQMNPQLQSMNLQGSVATMQQTEHANEDYWQEEVFQKPKKGKSFKKKGKGKKKPLKTKGGVQKPTTNQQDKGSCFHCGIPEHWKRNC